MSSTKIYSHHLAWLHNTILFFRMHFAVICTLGCIAGFGRVIQLNGFGPIDQPTHVFLEFIIETARLLLFVYVIGSASFKTGFSRIVYLFRQKTSRQLILRKALHTCKKNWKSVLLNFTFYLLLAWILNVLIDQLAYETCLYLNLKQQGILSNTASEWTIILFFKNLTVIPLTLVFNVMFLFWVSGKTGFNNKQDNTPLRIG